MPPDRKKIRPTDKKTNDVWKKSNGYATRKDDPKRESQERPGAGPSRQEISPGLPLNPCLKV
ncbi:hypothetical protein ABH19_04620 [Leptospirillum sp. Group II 'CF-1']|nr:hypothetical protein ABH19_04620 [Leptospirillum sp. Group II 'CF-1']